jgi:hypothetical protein
LSYLEGIERLSIMKYRVQNDDGQYLTQTPDFGNCLSADIEKAKIFEGETEFFQEHYPSLTIVPLTRLELDPLADKNFRLAIEDAAVAYLSQRLKVGEGLVRRYLKGESAPVTALRKALLKKLK